MDIVLKFCDEYFLTPYCYPESWPEDNWWRQLLSLNLIITASAAILYLITAGLSYRFLFDKRLLKHPHMQKDQVRKEITCTLSAMPPSVFLSTPVFLLEVRGHAKLYDTVDEAHFGWLSIIGSCFFLVAFTDFLLYWLHVGLHHKSIYKTLHKTHHQFVIPTPFASHAFHSVDSFLESLPYHFYVFLFPMHKVAFVGMFIMVNIWTVSIHDANVKIPDCLKWLVNGAAHHVEHHIGYIYNYGQFFTIWDRIGGTFRNPRPSLYEGRAPEDLPVAKAVSNGKKLD